MAEAEFYSLTVSFSTFFPQYWERWKFLLERGERRWTGIDPFKVWPNDQPLKVAPPLTVTHKGLNVSASDRLSRQLNESVVVFVCGGVKRSFVETMKLNNFLENSWHNSDYAEGFVSIVPGQLLMAWNHEGGACFWDRPRRAK
jgi:hypothetical protein